MAVPYALYIFCAGCIFAAFLSYLTRRSLYINPQSRQVEYTDKNLFQNKSWSRSFDEFRHVAVFRPQHSEALRKPVSTYLITLAAKNGDEFPLGTSPVGVLNLFEALHMADDIAKTMAIPVVRENSIEAV